MAVPKIRFPEFSDDWKLCSLEDILTERNVKQTISEDAPLLSFTIEQGVINPEDKKTNKRDFLMKDKSNKIFALTEVDDIIYNPANLKFGAIHRNKLRRGVVSPIYAIFYTNQSPAFVEALVRNPRFIKKSLTFLEGSVIKLMTLKPRDFVKMQVYIPSIEEQKRIADKLNKIDIVIASCQTEIEKMKELKRGLLQKMLPKAGQNTPELRFPGFTEAWEQRKFSDFAQRESEIQLSSYDSPCVEYEDVIAEEGRLNKDIRQKEVQKSGIRFDGTQVLYGKLRPYLHNWLNPDFTGVAVGDWWVLRPIGIDKNYLYRLIQTKLFDDVANQSAGSKMPRADWNLVSNTEFFIPVSIEEQSKIAMTFTNLDSLITLHQRECEKWQELKNGLLQQMFI